MQPTDLPASGITGLRTIELTAGSEPVRQRFFEANPLYFLAVNAEPAQPTEAHEEIHGELPAVWCFTRKWVFGYANAQGAVVAMSNIVSDLLAPSVWHIGIFIVETLRHGNGDGQALYRELEAWAVSNGASWLRLGVVQGNARAERFWHSQGFVEVRTGEGVQMGKLTNTLRVMVKARSAPPLENYLSLIPRDRPQP